MESQQSQAWFGIAQKVDTLLARPGARERFREMVKEAVADWLRRADLKQQREKARSRALKQKGVPYDPDNLPPNPKDGSFFWLDDLHDGGPDLGAWLPAELSPELDPDDSFPLPVPPDREVSLAEKYAVLAAVWDAHWEGHKKLNPWVEDELYREALCHSEDLIIVETWLRDVEADLAGAEAQAGAKRPKRRARYKTAHDPDADARLLADWRAAKATGVATIADFAERRGLSENDVRAALERARFRERQTRRLEPPRQ